MNAQLNKMTEIYEWKMSVRCVCANGCERVGIECVCCQIRLLLLPLLVR